MKHFYFLLVLFSNLFFSQNAVSWQILNPQPTREDGRNIKMLSQESGFYITAKEIIQTKDGGISWVIKQKINYGQDLDFKENTGLIVGSFGNIYISKDNGETWNSKILGSNENFVYSKVISANNLLTATINKLFISANGGLTWTQKAIPFTNVSKLYFLNNNTGFLGTQNGKIYKTVDGGNNWVLKNSVNYTPSDIFTFYFVNSSVGFAERGHGELIKTTDGGETWNKISSSGDKIYSFSFVNESIGFKVGEYGVIFKTTDGGDTWINKFFLPGRFGESSLNGVVFISENVGFAVGARGRIIKTLDGGNNWIQYSPFYNDVRSLNKVDNQLFAQVGLDIFKSTNDGKSWAVLNRPDDFLTPDPYRILQYATDIAFIDKNIGYLIGGKSNGDSRIYKTEDGGNSWIFKQKFNGSRINDLTFIDQNTGFVACGEGTQQYGFYRTTDGGNTWETQNTQLLLTKIKAFSKDLIYAIAYSRLYKSINGGKNWTLIFNEDSQQITDINFLDENNGYIIGNQSFEMRRTNDGGNTWTKIKTPYDFYNLVRFKTKNIGIIANEYGKISVTYDGGKNWETGSEYYGSNDFLYSGDEFYVGGLNGKIFKGTFQNIPDYILTTNVVTDFGAKRAKFTGSAASNSSDITDLQFMYSRSSSFSNPIYVDADISKIDALKSGDFSSEVAGLQPGTNYAVRALAKINGNVIYGNTINLKTLPPYSLNMLPAYGTFATSINLGGSGSAYAGDLSNIQIQYSTDNFNFTYSVDSVPSSVPEGNTNVSLGSILKDLKPTTKYFARIAANYGGSQVYSNVITFTTTKEYLLVLNEANVNASTVDLSADIYAYDKDITDITFEYGGPNFENSVSANPALILSQQYAAVTAPLNQSSLVADKNYYLRLKATTNGKAIYSNTVLFKVNKLLILLQDKNQILSNTEINVFGLIKSSDDNGFITNISVEYGKTNLLGLSKLTSPSTVYGASTKSFGVNLTQLEEGAHYFYKFSAIQNGVKIYSDLYEFTTSTLGIAELNKIKFKIYPNPAHEKIFFYGKDNIAKIEIYDLSGKLVISDSHQNMESVNVAKLPDATYIIKIYSAGTVVTEKFIKK